MSKFGLGLTEAVIGAGRAVWGWYGNIWKRWVGDNGEGFRPIEQIGGVFITIVALAIAIVATAVLVVVGIVAVVVDTVVEVVGWVGGLFNASDDDQARAAIGDMTCEQINALADDQLNAMTEAMLDGPTTDGDEEALLKVVGCLDCARLTGSYWPQFGDRIQSDLDGDQYDQLRVAMRRCRLTDFGQWDDDATRRYINGASCEELNLLTLDEVKTLLRNLFDGTTGNDDERAIVRLIECLQDSTVQTLVGEGGFSVDDFDDEVDGDQWNRLKEVFRGKGVAVN